MNDSNSILVIRLRNTRETLERGEWRRIIGCLESGLPKMTLVENNGTSKT